MPEGQLRVIESEQMQNRRVEIVYMAFVLDHFHSVIVGLAINHSALDAAAGQPRREGVGVMAAPVIADCYAAAADLDGRLLAFPYTDFPLLRIDVGERSLEVFPMPTPVRSADAHTSVGDVVWFVQPAHRGGAILRTDFRGQVSTQIGVLQDANVRGLPGGRLLAVRRTGFDVIDLKGGTQ